MTTLFSNHQFGFREHHSTTHQVYRIVNKIAKSLEEVKLCNAAFLDIVSSKPLTGSTFQMFKSEYFECTYLYDKPKVTVSISVHPSLVL